MNFFNKSNKQNTFLEYFNYLINFRTWFNFFSGKRYNEDSYLFYNRDVMKALKRGEFLSGRQHFIRCGFKERRLFQGLNTHFYTEYSSLIDRLIKQHPNNLDLAMAISIGSPTLDHFRHIGDIQYLLLREIGLRDDMSIYDIGCGSGRTVSALLRHGWKGNYTGVDVVEKLVDYLNKKNPTVNAFVHKTLDIKAENSSLDIVIAFSLFTHLTYEESYIYFLDIFRALKPGGKLIFSFITIKSNKSLFLERVKINEAGKNSDHLDTFITKEIIEELVKMAGFSSTPIYFDSHSGVNQMGQSIAVVIKDSD